MSDLAILVVEDKPLTAEDITYTLEQFGYKVAGVAHSGGEALEALVRLKPDLVLLDIDLGEGMNGIAVAQVIAATYQIPFIFLTARADTPTLEQAKATRPMAYIVKPFTPNDLRAAIEIAMFNVAQGQAATFKQAEPEEKASLVPAGSFSLFVKHKGRFEKLQQEDILLVEAEDTYSRIVVPERNYLVSFTLKAMAERLSHPDLVRVHRSYIVNVKKVEAIEDNTLIIGKKLVPVSKSYREKVMKLFQFL